MCVLMNVASATERTRDHVVEHDEILSGIAAVLVRVLALLLRYVVLHFPRTCVVIL